MPGKVIRDERTGELYYFAYRGTLIGEVKPSASIARASTRSSRPTGPASCGSQRVQTAVTAIGAIEGEASPQADETVARELAGFTAVVEKRFGEGGMRGLLLAQQPGTKPYDGDSSSLPSSVDQVWADHSREHGRGPGRDRTSEPGRAIEAIKVMISDAAKAYG